MPDVVRLTPDDWPKLREIRLSALRESPQAFLSTYEREIRYDEGRWRAEFIRGDWDVGVIQSQPVGLVGSTREPDTPEDQRNLEYIWVSPEFRGNGVAFRMLSSVLNQLRLSGVKTVFLWVLDGNDGAVRLYRRLGFASSNHRQPLEDRPGRSEERMHLDLP